ncbi:unnamed protein product [Prunus brigantina]
MHKEGLRWQQEMCVQVCPTVLHQGYEKEERLASFFFALTSGWLLLKCWWLCFFGALMFCVLWRTLKVLRTTCMVFSCMQLLDQSLWLFKEGLVYRKCVGSMPHHLEVP